MSIKHKLATAMATAGLLAGIFGSTLAPVANGVSTAIDKYKIMAALDTNLTGDWQDLAWGDASEPSGTASSPYVIYSPEYNDGGANDTAVTKDLETYVDVADVEYLTTGDNLTLDDDVQMSVSMSGGLLVWGDDTTSATNCPADEADYASSYTDSVVTHGFYLCFAVTSDTAAFDSVATIKVNGTEVGKLYFKVVGPATSFSLSPRFGTDKSGTPWVAMDNQTVSDAFVVTFLDAAKHNLWTSLRDSSSAANGGGEDMNDIGCEARTSYGDVMDCITAYYKTGNAALDDGGYNLQSAVDYIVKGDDWDGLDGLDKGSQDRYLNLKANFCDSTREAVGSSHKAYVALDSNNVGTVSTADIIADPLTVKCSDDGYFAEITGWDFGGATTVEAGDTIPLFLRIGDGSGNPLGAGAVDIGTGGDTFGGLNEYGGGYPYYDQLTHGDPAFSFYPNHTQPDNSDYFDYRGMVLEFENPDDGDTLCGAPGTESDNTLEADEELVQDYMLNDQGSGEVKVGDDAPPAGTVILCYTASMLPEDISINTLKLRVTYPWVDFATDYLDASAKTFTAAITVTKPGAAGVSQAWGTFVKVGKKTVSITGPVGAKVTFFVENSAGVVRSYNRIVEAKDGKAKFVFKVRGTFDVYAMYGDTITGLSRITVKL